MRYGECVSEGFLPVFSVANKDEAQKLLTMACETNIDGDFIAKELAKEQTIDNLMDFSYRLGLFHDRLIETGQCECA